jgi:beta-adrenergic-receptor kinase
MTIFTRTLTEDDFSLFRVLGRGGFGLVNGCKKCDSGHLYAMKVLDRKRLKLKKSEQLCLNERNILVTVDSKFITCLKYAFTSPTQLFLILDLMMGGDLNFQLRTKGHFKKKHAKYYIARTILGIKALHELNVVFRDLKPENILMDKKGFTKISDLGLAVVVPKRGCVGACGTRGYWAPEMMLKDENGHRKSYGLCVDWFSVGCVLYEFLTCVCPFRTPAARCWNNLKGDSALDAALQEMEPPYDPKYFSDEVTISFISSLLCKDPNSRLGNNGPEEVMRHPYFNDIVWDEIICECIQPPIVPDTDINCASQNDIGDFSVSAKAIELTKEDVEFFSTWNYCNLNAQQEEAVEFMRYEEVHVSHTYVHVHILLIIVI